MRASRPIRRPVPLRQPLSDAARVGGAATAPAATGAPADRAALIQALALDLLSTYIARGNAREWLHYAHACDSAAGGGGGGDAKAAAEPVPPERLVTDTAPARMFVCEARLRLRPEKAGVKRPTGPQDDPAVYRAALQWFVRVLLLITTAQPPPTFVRLTTEQTSSRPLATWEGSFFGAHAPVPDWADGDRPRPHHLLWINGFNARVDAVRPFGPNESDRPYSSPDGSPDDTAPGCTDAWVIAEVDLQPPLFTACRYHHVLAHALLDVPSGDARLQGGGQVLNANFVTGDGATALYHAALQDRAIGYGAAATVELLELLLALRGLADADAHLSVLQWLCSADGGLPDDNSGFDLAECDADGRTIDDVLGLNADAPPAMDPELRTQYTCTWERARDIAAAGVNRVRAYLSALRVALHDTLGSDRDGGPVLLPPLLALVCDYVLWP